MLIDAIERTNRKDSKRKNNQQLPNGFVLNESSLEIVKRFKTRRSRQRNKRDRSFNNLKMMRSISKEVY